MVNDFFDKENFILKGENDDLNMIYRDELKLLEILLFCDFMSGWIYY